MKNTLNLIAFSLITFFIVSCSQGEGPEVVAKAFIDAINAQDYKKAKEYSTDDCKVVIEFLSTRKQTKEAVDKEVVNDLKCEIEGDTTAVCTCFNSKKEKISVSLKKVSDKWLVSSPKETPIGFNDTVIEKVNSDSSSASELDTIIETK
jgi:hypothetical protein